MFSKSLFDKRTYYYGEWGQKPQPPHRTGKNGLLIAQVVNISAEMDSPPCRYDLHNRLHLSRAVRWVNDELADSDFIHHASG